MVISLAFLYTVFIFGDFSKSIMTTEGSSDMAAAVFFTQSTTSESLQNKYDIATTTKRKLNVLIVPGHEPTFGGTEFLNVMERDLNADLGLALAQYLVEDGHYEVVMTRGKEGWNPNLENYFNANIDSIKTFVRSQKDDMARLVGEGRITTIDGLPHNEAPTDVALRLYGINKWANEHSVDIVVHIHFNDNSPRKANKPGKYNGFTIYTPERQYSNAEASKEISNSVFKRLSKMFPVSNLEGEDAGVVEDQELIAIGSYNTVDAASILVEYGYIYEPQFRVEVVKDMVLKELAFQTYLGVADFFGEMSLIVGPYESTLLPYSVKTQASKTNSPSPEVLAFQAALTNKGYYPPEGYSRNDCPLSGFFGGCTKKALIAFQKELEIKGEAGIIGTKTRYELRKLFEPSLVSVNSN